MSASPKVGLDRSKTGRAKGTPNKSTKQIKDMIEGALNAAGGQAYLVQQAKENPSAFLTLVGKILPKDINATIAGELAISSIKRVIVKHDNAGN